MIILVDFHVRSDIVYALFFAPLIDVMSRCSVKSSVLESSVLSGGCT